MKQTALQLFRLGVLLVIAWLIRDLAGRQRTEGDFPVKVEEVTKFFTNAATLRADSSERDGLFVLDREGRELGYVVRTQPRCRDIIGYCGITDTLIAFDREWTILGMKIRRSEDTRQHVGDVAMDRRFLKKWNGMTWDAAAELDLKKAGIEGVSGATMTSMGIARAVKQRLKLSKDELAAPFTMHFGWRDGGMFAVLGAAGLMCFGKPAWRQRWRRVFQVALVVYVGFISGDLIAQSLVAGWARSGIPWQTAPGLTLLVGAALLVPAVTRKPLYCHHLCPHGAAQELLGHAVPARWRVKLPAGLVRGLEYLPGALLVAVLVAVMLALPLDLAGIEPFDAYLIRNAGFATIAVAVVGLVASLFVPQAYCRFGCPTGALLNFVRARGPTDRFTRRDGAALLLVALAALLNWKALPLSLWLMGVE